MGTITMSGFNKIDWNAILDAVMTQERQPLTTMQSQRSTLSSKASAFSTLATRLSAVETAASDLKSVSALGGRTVTSTDTSSVTATASSTAMSGTYDIEVSELARAQVTTLSAADGLADTTVVATGGALTFLDAGGHPILDADDQQTGIVSLPEGSYTLQQLADAINAAKGVPARATIVQAEGNYRLVVTGTATGAANGFTIQNALSGGVALTSAEAMPATDADLLVNNVRVTSASNVIEGAIDGVSLTVLRKTSAGPVGVTVAEDASVTQSKLDAFVSAYNGLLSYASDQATAARNGDIGNIGYDPLLRSLRATLSGALNRSYPVEGTFQSLAQIGLGFDRTGKLKLDKTVLADAMKTHRADVEHLLAGSTGIEGAFSAIGAVIGDYTRAGGLVPDAKSRLESQMTALDGRISAMEARLTLRQRTLQAEYAAADAVISQLNSQAGSLSSLSNSYSAF
jgi:flagellar hook-associated protein 2